MIDSIFTVVEISDNSPDKKKLDPFEFTDTYQSELIGIVRPQKKSEDLNSKLQKVRSLESESSGNNPDPGKDVVLKRHEVEVDIVKATSKKSNETKTISEPIIASPDHPKKTTKEIEVPRMPEKIELADRIEERVSSEQQIAVKVQDNLQKGEKSEVDLTENAEEYAANPDLNQTLDSSMSQEEEEFENMGYVSGDDTTNYADEAYPQNNDITQPKPVKNLEENLDKTQKKSEEVNICLHENMHYFCKEKMFSTGF